MPAGRGGALARSSASISFEQMGQLAVMRLWRQNSDVMVAPRDASGMMRPPRAGVSVTPRRRMRSPSARSGRRSKRPTTARSTSCSSMVANAAPAQRRTPPPNGSHAYGGGAPSRKRSGRNAVGSGHSSGRRWAR